MGGPDWEEVYISPSNPAGIYQSTLHMVDTKVQRETALFWFFANLRPHAQHREAIGTIDRTFVTLQQADVASDAKLEPVDALDVLQQEFRGVLPDEVIVGLGDLLGFGWVWIEDEHEARSAADQREAAALALQDLADMLSAIGPAHGGPGHNQPDGVPLSGEDRDEALQSIGEIQKRLQQGVSIERSWLNQKWEPVQRAIAAFGGWAVQLAGRCITTLCEEGARSTGKALPYLIMLGVDVYYQGPVVHRLLEALTPK